MTLDADEFIRRFLIHVLPDGFHRIRHPVSETAGFSRFLKSYHPKYHPKDLRLIPGSKGYSRPLRDLRGRLGNWLSWVV